MVSSKVFCHPQGKLVRCLRKSDPQNLEVSYFDACRSSQWVKWKWKIEVPGSIDESGVEVRGAEEGNVNGKNGEIWITKNNNVNSILFLWNREGSLKAKKNYKNSAHWGIYIWKVITHNVKYIHSVLHVQLTRIITSSTIILVRSMPQVLW